MSLVAGKGFAAVAVGLASGILVLGLALVWLNIQRVDLAYEVKKLEARLGEQTALVEKLKVERDNLASPPRLRSMAERMGLSAARPGQLRAAPAGGPVAGKSTGGEK